MSAAGPGHLTLVMAPLRGITDSVFRTAFARHFGGFDWALAPFVTSVKGARVALSHIADLQPERNQLLRVVPQVLSNDPGELLAIVNAFADMGYAEVNWNLGCPFVKVTRKRRGSGLLPHPDRVVAILDHVLPSARAAVSIKTRLGLEDPGDLARLLPRFAPYPLASVTIHPRTADQMYDGQLRMDRFAECLTLTSHPVLYSGDITTVDTFRNLAQRFEGKVSGWMIGRGAVRDPFLPGAIRGDAPPDAATRCARVRALHEELFERCQELMPGPAALLARMKELWGLLADAVPNGRHRLGAIQRCQSVGTYCRLTDEVLAPERAAGR